MPPPQRVRAWIGEHYRKPAVDQEWLTDCSHWVQTELGCDPNMQFDDFIQHVEVQLLQSNLADSMVPASGIDPLLFAPDQNPPRRQRKSTGPTPLLVEIKSITEIAHSAFGLLNTHQTRVDRADLGLAQEHDTDLQRDEDEGPVPRFPRGMLKFELSDGSTTFRAIEFRALPQLELGTTPLGYKMVLKSTPIRNGIAFLEPQNVILKGYSTEDHDINHDEVFLSSLRRRLGRPDPPSETPTTVQPQSNPPAQPAQVAPQRPPPIPRPPSPPDDMDDIDPDVLREMAIQMDAEIDRPNQRPGARPPPPGSANPRQIKSNTSSSLKAPSNASTVKTSAYFPDQSRQSQMTPDIGLSPRPAPPPNLEPDSNTDKPRSSKVPINMKPGSASAMPPSTAPLKPPPAKRPLSPDPFDDLSFDMDVDFDRLDMIEQDALATGTGTKDKGKSRKKDLSTGTQSRVKPATSLSNPTGSHVPLAGRSSRDHRIRQDSSLIVISSSEDEAGGHGKNKPLDVARRRAKKPRRTDQNEGPDVIDITD